MLADIATGFRFLLRDRAMTAISLGSLAFNFFGFIAAAVFIPFLKRDLGASDFAVGYALGFGALDHYVFAPIGAHSVAMNASIIAEVSAASALLIFIAYLLLTSRKPIGLS